MAGRTRGRADYDALRVYRTALVGILTAWMAGPCAACGGSRGMGRLGKLVWVRGAREKRSPMKMAYDGVTREQLLDELVKYDPMCHMCAIDHGPWLEMKSRYRVRCEQQAHEAQEADIV